MASMVPRPGIKPYCLKLKHPFRKKTAGQNSPSFLGPSKWNKIPEPTKMCKNINTFKHNLKKLYLAQLANQVSLLMLLL